MAVPAPPGLGHTFFEQLLVQRRVIGALLMREMLTRYGRRNIGFLWLFAEPMMVTLIVTALWTTRGLHQYSDIPIAAFAITGYSGIQLWRNMSRRCIDAIEPNRALLRHRPVKMLDIYLARMLLEVAGTTTSFALLCVMFLMFSDQITPPEDILEVAYAWGLFAWFSMGMSISLGALSELTPLVNKFWPPFIYIFYPLSGAMFLVDILPHGMREFVAYIPMVHANEMLRHGFFGSHFTAHYDISYLIGWCLGLCVFGLGLSRMTVEHRLS
ncbi:ABC transporter permease [Sphingobium vermicomposti]|uniref:ABC-type polysaccharide/polyol phosphate export permease n=1 Tax=Sphingobium vermicomposti TaxID=529005 RepID=A0A846M0L6_9SPHN|nr:ABC transporter permease [Sphingobium vermicomposti]NIJ15462.1 ABC-type polysaccharide/polyol phosphate export permease [Sphingobium vermicomposti]